MQGIIIYENHAFPIQYGAEQGLGMYSDMMSMVMILASAGEYQRIPEEMTQ